MNSVNFSMVILAVDLLGSVAMIVVSLLCFKTARSISRQEPGNFMYGYLSWLFAALLAFSLSRALGHIIKHVLILTGHTALWMQLSPVSGSINSATFIVIASITLFFRTMRRIMNRMARDRERIRRISRELLNLNQNTEAIVSERTKTELALKVAHEIRNPVMVIGGLARRLLKDEISGAERQERLKTILEQANRLNSIVEKFENIQGELSWAFNRINVSRLIRETIEIIAPEAEEKGVRLFFHHPDTALHIEANSYLIKMGLLHCIRNALDTSDPGQVVEILAEKTDVGVIIGIKDHGRGIPAPVLRDIFQPVYNRERKSRGLGLAVVKQIVEEHGGRVEISSTPGNGTEIRIFLPTQLGTAKSWKQPGENIEQ